MENTENQENTTQKPLGPKTRTELQLKIQNWQKEGQKLASRLSKGDLTEKQLNELNKKFSQLEEEGNLLNSKISLAVA